MTRPVAARSGTSSPETARAALCNPPYWRWTDYWRCYRRSFPVPPCRWPRYIVPESSASPCLIKPRSVNPFSSNLGHLFDRLLAHVERRGGSFLQHLKLPHDVDQPHRRFRSPGVGCFELALHDGGSGVRRGRGRRAGRAEVVIALLGQPRGSRKIDYMQLANRLAVLADRAIAGNLDLSRSLEAQHGAARATYRITVRRSQRAVGRQVKTAVAGIQRPARRLDREKPFAGKRQVEGVAGGLDHALREIDPRPLDHRHGGDLARIRGLGRYIEAVEFAVGLVSPGGGVRHVVGHQVERFHAGAKAAGRHCGHGIHGGIDNCTWRAKRVCGGTSLIAR